MSGKITYKFLNKKNLLVLSDENTHKSFFNYLNGFWSKENNGWILPKNKEKELKNFIASQKLPEISSEIKSRKTQHKYHREVSESESESDSSDDVKSKKSYSDSDSEIEIDDVRILNMLEKKDKTQTNVADIEKEDLQKRKNEEKRKFEEDKSNFDKKSKGEKDKTLKKKYVSDDPMLYYKSFNTQPKTFKNINNYKSDDSLSVSSSSCSSSGSSDNFPSPKTPKKRRNYNKGLNNENYDDMLSEVKTLSRRIIELELENKKLKSKNK